MTNGNPEELETLRVVASQSTAERALLGARFGREDLEAGITTVRDLGNSGMNGDVALRNAIDRGWLPRPRVARSIRSAARSSDLRATLCARESETRAPRKYSA